MDPLSFLCVCVCFFSLLRSSCQTTRFSFVGGTRQSRVKLSLLFFFFSLSVRCLRDEICPEYVWALCLTAALSSECRPHTELSKQRQELKAVAAVRIQRCSTLSYLFCPHGDSFFLPLQVELFRKGGNFWAAKPFLFTLDTRRRLFVAFCAPLRFVHRLLFYCDLISRCQKDWPLCSWRDEVTIPLLGLTGIWLEPSTCVVLFWPAFEFEGQCYTHQTKLEDKLHMCI